MVKQNKKAFCGAVLAAVFLLLCLTACRSEVPQGSGPAPTPPVAESTQPGQTEEPIIQAASDFSCYTLDANGQKIHGYASEETGMWYLFVPGTLDVSALTLYVSDNVEEVSSGTLDTGASIVSGAFANGCQLTLTCDSGTARVRVMQSDLPSLHIVLTDTTLDTIHQDKDEKAKGNSIYLIDPSGEYDLTMEGSVELKGRGNSSWKLFDKKGYQIKFDEKMSVFGMGKAKKWVLLANASDDSMMRTQLVYQTAAQMGMTFVPSFEYIDLWINGDYRGTYIIGEKIELGGSRLDLEDSFGALFEHDEGFYQEEDYWFRSDYLERHFVLKESVEEDDETMVLATMDAFSAAVDELMEYLYSTPSHLVTLDELSEFIDVDSFVKYYLINEYTLNRESFNTSFYWYKDGPEDVIHLGPIWDFDTCMGNDGADHTGNYGNNHILFEYLLAIPEFYQRTQELLAAYAPLLADMDSAASELSGRIEQSAEMNYLRWNVLGKANPKGGTDFHATFEEAVETLRGWLERRETAFAIPTSVVATSVVSDDCGTMKISFGDGRAYGEVRFAVWNKEHGQDDLVWYPAQLEDGMWTAAIDLSPHNAAGVYQYDVYSGSELLASGRNFVATAREPDITLEGAISPDGATMELTLKDGQAPYEQLWLQVWNDRNGQDDLRWYPAVSGGAGQWTCTVDLEQHGGKGAFYIRAYSGENEPRILETMAIVQAGEPELTMDEGNGAVTLTLFNVDWRTQRVWFAVWTDENGQDDLVWYTASKSGVDWTVQVSQTNHPLSGTCHIHIYGGGESPEDLILAETVEIGGV